MAPLLFCTDNCQCSNRDKETDLTLIAFLVRAKLKSASDLLVTSFVDCRIHASCGATVLCSFLRLLSNRNR